MDSSTSKIEIDRSKRSPPRLSYVLLGLGSLIALGGCLLLKLATPSPHGFIELFVALPLVGVGAALVSVGLFLFRSRSTLIAGLVTAMVAIGGVSPIPLALSGVDGDGPSALVYYPFVVPAFLTSWLVFPFVDSRPENPVIEGIVYAAENPRPGAASKAVFGDRVTLPSRGVTYTPLPDAQLSVWTEANYHCHRELREYGACAGAVPDPLVSARSDSNGRFKLTYSLNPFGKDPPGLVHAEMGGCEPVDAKMMSLLNTADRVVTFLMVCAEKKMEGSMRGGGAHE